MLPFRPIDHLAIDRELVATAHRWDMRLMRNLMVISAPEAP
jgi:hypothetical protein